MKHRIPTWLLERIALGETPPERAAEVREILASDPDEQARLVELERSNAEILAELPPERVAAEVARRAAAEAGLAAIPVAPPNGHRRRLMLLSSGLAAAAGVVLVAVALGRQVGWLEPTPRPADPGGEASTDDPGDTRPKGSPRLLLHRKRGTKAEPLDVRRDLARAGDRIQISYRAGDAVHGVILSIDGAGQVTLHYPAQPVGSTVLKRDGAVSLGHSYELDDAPSYERFLFLTSAQPIDVAAVLASANQLASDPHRAPRDSLSLSSNMAQLWITLRKEAAP
jgi:hypothetical protein